MWRTASLGIVGACALSVLGNYTLHFVNKSKHRFLILPWFVLLLITAVVYPVSRLLLLALAATSLRSLSPSSFDTIHWVEFVPHI